MLYYIKIILLFTTCFVLILTFFELRSKKIKRDKQKFILSSLIVTLFLALIIEVKPHHMLRNQLNISNLIIYSFYFIVVSSYFLRYFKLLSKDKFVLIVISLMFFGLANAIDLLSDGKLIDFNYNEILEDFFHILGIIFWLSFFIDYSKLLKRDTNIY